MSAFHMATAEDQHEGSKEMQCIPKKYPEGRPKKAIRNDVSTTWFATTGHEAIPDMVTAKTQHEGSKEMECALGRRAKERSSKKRFNNLVSDSWTGGHLKSTFSNGQNEGPT